MTKTFGRVGTTTNARTELTAKEVLDSVYKELLEQGEVKRELKGSIALAGTTDGVREDYSLLVFKGAIVGIGYQDFIFVRGDTNKTWRHLSKVDDAVSFGRIDWELVKKDIRCGPWPEGLPSKQAVAALTEAQAKRILNGYDEDSHRPFSTVRKSQLVESWKGVISIRDGFDENMGERFVQIPDEYVASAGSNSTRLVVCGGSRFMPPVVIRKDPDVRYTKETVAYLRDYILKKAGTPDSD